MEAGRRNESVSYFCNTNLWQSSRLVVISIRSTLSERASLFSRNTIPVSGTRYPLFCCHFDRLSYTSCRTGNVCFGEPLAAKVSDGAVLAVVSKSSIFNTVDYTNRAKAVRSTRNSHSHTKYKKMIFPQCVCSSWRYYYHNNNISNNVIMFCDW